MKALKTTFNIAALVVGGAGIALGATLLFSGLTTADECMGACIFSQSLVAGIGGVTGAVSGLIFWAGLNGIKKGAAPGPTAP